MPHIDVALSKTVTGCFSVDVSHAPQQPTVGAHGNLAHHRPHHPKALNAARHAVGERSKTAPANWHLMRQIHSGNVGIITTETPVGAEIRDVDALVTTAVNRTLGVFTADCLPILICGLVSIAVVHAGRAGIEQRIVTNTVQTMLDLGEEPTSLKAVIGPAIGGCCYELPDAMVQAFLRHTPTAQAQTSWGTPALDLNRAALNELAEAGVDDAATVGICTACDGSWFSHRRDPNAGRAVALITRHETT